LGRFVARISLVVLNVDDAEMMEPLSCCVSFSCLAQMNPESETKTKPKLGKKIYVIPPRVLNLLNRLASFQWRNAEYMPLIALFNLSFSKVGIASVTE
jgi:hypothetical protein